MPINYQGRPPFGLTDNQGNPIFQSGFQLVDDRGNPLNIFNQRGQNRLRSPKNGIFRTNLPEITKDTKVDMTGREGLSILVNIMDPSEIGSRILNPLGDQGSPRNPGGFTPQWAYYIKGTASMSRMTGLSTEIGQMLVNATSNVNKISRTDLVESTNDQGMRTVTLKFTSGTVNGNQNLYLGKNLTGDPTYGGWVNPAHYVTRPDNINDKTALPKELGDFPYNYSDQWGAAFFTENVTRLYKTTPQSKVDGFRTNSEDDGIPSKREAFQRYREAKTFETIGYGGMEQYDFVHNLDRKFHDDLGNTSNDVYLASFVDITTNLERFGNEDPVMFGFDIIIDWKSSPLFNGAIPEFIEKMAFRAQANATGAIGNSTTTNSELYSRLDVYARFLDQFQKFFRINSQSLQYEADTGNASVVTAQNQVVKTYYLKKIAGLDLLVEGPVTNSSDTVKSMVDYGKDLIKLTLYEDVTVNTGHIGVLYKTLAWSRLNGKQLIPENLLRFDCKIVVSEIRNYKRLVKREGDPNNPDSPLRWEEYVDNVNKYIYKLYDCQFQFDKLSHGDTLDMWKPQTMDDYDISFSFKYSNLKFEKFNPKKYVISNRKEVSVQIVDNSKDDATDWFTRIKSGDGTSNVYRVRPRQDGSLGLTASPGSEYVLPWNMEPTDVYPDEPNLLVPSSELYRIGQIEEEKKSGLSQLAEGIDKKLNTMGLGQAKLLDRYKRIDGKWDKYKNSVETTLEKAKRDELNKRLRQDLGRRLRSAAAREINRRVTDQARLLNRTLDNIRNSIGIGRMSSPTNVYEQDFLLDDIRNAFRQFVGQSVRGFFTR